MQKLPRNTMQAVEGGSIPPGMASTLYAIIKKLDEQAHQIRPIYLEGHEFQLVYAMTCSFCTECPFDCELPFSSDN